MSFLQVCAYLEIYKIEYILVQLCWNVFKQQTNLSELNLKEQIFNSNNYNELFQVIQNVSLPSRTLHPPVS